jgi:hypothetical protein
MLDDLVGESTWNRAGESAAPKGGEYPRGPDARIHSPGSHAIVADRG